MVKYIRISFFFLLICSLFALNSCNNDIFGMFGSNDLSKRWQARNKFNFLTPAERNLATLGDTYSFIVLADTHIDDKNDLKLDKLKAVIEKSAIDGDEIKFVVISGDVTQKGERKEINKFIKQAGELGIPCYPVAGNHDVYFGNWPEWEKLIGSTIYRIDGGNTTLLILDSATGFFGNKQLDWLEKELKTAGERVFVFTHYNVFVKSPTDIQQLTDIRERARLTSILKDKCDIMFMGHLHKHIENKLGGVEYLAIEDYRDKAAYCLLKLHQKKFLGKLII